MLQSTVYINFVHVTALSTVMFCICHNYY